MELGRGDYSVTNAFEIKQLSEFKPGGATIMFLIFGPLVVCVAGVISGALGYETMGYVLVSMGALLYPYVMFQGQKYYEKGRVAYDDWLAQLPKETIVALRHSDEVSKESRAHIILYLNKTYPGWSLQG